MTVVDSSVLIDYFHDRTNPATEKLEALLDNEQLAIGDLILMEVLQGFVNEASFNEAQRVLMSYELVHMAGAEISIEAARNYRVLRRRGITVRSTIDCLIATSCILHGHTLLHNDRDFEPFARHLGLRTQPVARLQ